MFARMFPTDLSSIYQGVYDGTLTALCALPVSVAINTVNHLLSSAMLNWAENNQHTEAGAGFLNGYIPTATANLEAQKKQTQDLNMSGQYKAMACFFIPVVEEFIFRGAITPALQVALRSVNVDPSYAAILSNILFALAHSTNKLSILHFGNQLEHLVSRHNGSLWPSITAHSIYNLIGVLTSKTPEEQTKEIDKQINRLKLLQTVQDLRQFYRSEAQRKKATEASLDLVQSDIDKRPLHAASR